jgi:hypothetical protein
MTFILWCKQSDDAIAYRYSSFSSLSNEKRQLLFIAGVIEPVTTSTRRQFGLRNQLVLSKLRAALVSVEVFVDALKCVTRL